jgi:hypothetical protein
MFPEASKKVLAQHLREMEKDGLVIRKDLSGRLRHVEYFLSDSMGFAVLHLIGTLTKWGREYLPYGANAPEYAREPRHADCELKPTQEPTRDPNESSLQSPGLHVSEKAQVWAEVYGEEVADPIRGVAKNTRKGTKAKLG